MTAWPSLGTGEVHVWGAALDEPAGTLHALLSADECLRRDRYLLPTLRERFARGRGLLRVALGRYMDMAPEGVQFTYGAQEKPAVRGNGVQFNLSHSGDRWLLAVSRDCELGVDIEHCRPLDDMGAMVRRFFAPGERVAIAALPESQRHDAFYRVWTRKEAVMKATGQGMALALDAFEVSTAATDPRLLSHLHDPTAPARWILKDLPAPPGYAAALCAGAAELQLQCMGDLPHPERK